MSNDNNFAIRFVVALTDVLTGEQVAKLLKVARGGSDAWGSPSLGFTDTPKLSTIQEQIILQLFERDSLKEIADEGLKSELASAREELAKAQEYSRKCSSSAGQLKYHSRELARHAQDIVEVYSQIEDVEP